MITIDFLNFPLEVPLNQTVREHYYYKNKKVPERLLNRIGQYYDWDNQGVLYDIATGKAVVSNSKSVGKTKTISVNGNQIWHIPKNDKETRIKIRNVGLIKRFLVDYFISELTKKLTKPENIQFPLKIKFLFFMKEHTADLDNLVLFYQKAFLDSIQYEYFATSGKNQGKKIKNPVGLVPEDTTQFINDLHYKHYVNPNYKHNVLRIIIKW